MMIYLSKIDFYTNFIPDHLVDKNENYVLLSLKFVHISGGNSILLKKKVNEFIPALNIDEFCIQPTIQKHIGCVVYSILFSF